MTPEEEQKLREDNARLQALMTEQRKLFATIYTAMLVAGWREDEVVRLVKAAR